MFPCVGVIFKIKISKMKSFGQLLTNSYGFLSQLSQHSQMLEQVNHKFQDSLPIPLNQYCHVANLREQTLIVHTDSSLWATRLRLIIPDLKQLWQQNQSMPAINQVIVQVRPPV
jgi:hypothetical protein